MSGEPLSGRAGVITSLVTALAGVFFLSFGLWAFFGTRSFFEEIAHFEPYNRHLVHDLGAFQIAIGAALLLALVWPRDAVFAVLSGAAVGAVFHATAHIIDRDLGGRGSDPWTVSAIAVVLLLAAFARWRATARGART
jgi:uncharacterized membrane protein